MLFTRKKKGVRTCSKKKNIFLVVTLDYKKRGGGASLLQDNQGEKGSLSLTLLHVLKQTISGSSRLTYNKKDLSIYF